MSEAVVFYNANRESLDELAEKLALPERATENLDTWVAVSQPWTRGDHARPAERIAVDDRTGARLHELYEAMGLKHDLWLPEGVYDQIAILGSTQLGNNRRVQHAQQMLDRSKATTNHLVMLGGERAPFEESELPLIDTNIKQLAEQDPNDPWIQQLLSGEAAVNWETDMLRLSTSIHLGRLTTVATFGAGGEGGSYPAVTHFTCNQRDLLVSLTHSKAVPRPGGAPRHTTASSIPDWLRLLPPKTGAKVGFVTANPHIERTTRVAQNVIAAAGRDDIELIASGSAAAQTYRHEIFLGEVARNLYEDQQAVLNPQRVQSHALRSAMYRSEAATFGRAAAS
jgi:hypothetical protein